jgi:hypothetical protein
MFNNPNDALNGPPSAPASLHNDILALGELLQTAERQEDLFALALLAHATSALPGHLVTVGAGIGHTAVVLGRVVRDLGRGRVFAVDLFPDADDTPDDDGWSLDSFLRTVDRAGLLEHVLPHYGTAATFAQLMPRDFGSRLVVLESAQACTNVSTDIFTLDQFLVPGGWLCVGSGFSSFPGAQAALTTLFRQRDHFDLIRQITPGLLAARRKA